MVSPQGDQTVALGCPRVSQVQMSKCKTIASRGWGDGSVHKVLALEDQSSDPQSPCKCRVGTVTLLRFERQKGDFPEQAGEISLQAALALVESPRLWIKGLGGIRRLWTSALGLHMHQHVHMCPYTAEHTHSRRLTHHVPTHTHSFLYNIPCYTPSAHIHHSHTLTHSYPHTHSYTTHTTYTHTTSLYLPRPHTHTQHTHTSHTHTHYKH